VRFILSRKFHSFLGQHGAYTRRKGLDRETNKALLMRHIEERRETGAAMKELEEVLPALSRRQILSLLQQLRGEGKVHPEGERRGARWRPGAEEKL
jgi:ATP-dependent DNA helicase RecG